MKILFDHGTPRPLRQYLIGHLTDTAAERGWETLRNGDPISIAGQEGYDVLITTDQNMRYQQNLSGVRLAILVLLKNDWSLVRLKTDEIRAALDEVQPGEIREVPI